MRKGAWVEGIGKVSNVRTMVLNQGLSFVLQVKRNERATGHRDMSPGFQQIRLHGQ